MQAKKITTPATIDNSLSPSIKWYKNLSFSLIFKGSCLKPKKKKNTTYTPPNIISFFIVYELDAWSRDINSDFTLKDCLFGDVKIAKTTDTDNYVYSGYGIAIDSRSDFLLPDGSVGKNVIIFGVDMSSSVNIDNKNKDILTLDILSMQGLDDTTLTGETKYSINYSRSNKRFCLSLHYNGSNSLLFLMLQKYINSKQNTQK